MGRGEVSLADSLVETSQLEIGLGLSKRLSFTLLIYQLYSSYSLISTSNISKQM